MQKEMTLKALSIEMIGTNPKLYRVSLAQTIGQIEFLEIDPKLNTF